MVPDGTWPDRPRRPHLGDAAQWHLCRVAEAGCTAFVAGAAYFRGLLTDLGLPQDEPTVLHVDNQGAIALATDRRSCNRSRHVDRRYFKVRELVAPQPHRPAVPEPRALVENHFAGLRVDLGDRAVRQQQLEGPAAILINFLVHLDHG